MPFDPTLPQENTPVDAAQMRGQLNGLKELIDAVPAGPQGAPGVQGPPFANAVVEGVTTVPAGGSATVSVFFDGTDVRFSFGIPRGDTGAQGEVSNAAMSSAISTAIAGTSNITNAVATLDAPFTNDPPTLTDIELLRAKMNELILAARR